jgi:hypothetical protein
LEVFAAIPEAGADEDTLVDDLLKLVPWNGVSNLTNNSNNRMRQNLIKLRELGALCRTNGVVSVARMPKAIEIAHWFH